MGLGLASRFAFRNLKANKIFVIPFILSSSIMIALFNIMETLENNHYVHHSYATLPMLLSMGIIIIGIFSFVFIIYANRFMTKRRNKEFSLYRIMGLEKKHIVRIILVEEIIIFAIISALSLIGGYVMGKIIFLFVNKLIETGIASLSQYYFSVKAAKYTMIYVGVVFAAIFATNIKSISTASPIELLSKQYSGEKEPKSRYLITLAGLGLLAAGYVIAITTEGNLKSLGMFFGASLLVIAATYVLFVTLSIVVLKMLKSNKNRYYKPENFISISGMIYRMRGNALGLASIAVLCTGVIITISATFTLYSNMNTIVETTMPRTYKLETVEDVPVSDSKKIEYYRNELKKKVYESAGSKDSVQNFYISEEIYIPALKNDGEIIPSSSKKTKDGKYIFLMLNKDHDFGMKTGKSVNLSDNELIYATNNKTIGGFKEIKINGKKMKAIEDRDSVNVPGNVAIESIKIVVNPKVYREIVENYSQPEQQTGRLGSASESIYANWDMKNEPSGYFDKTKKMAAKSKMELESRESFSKGLKEIYGGIMFLGMVIGAVFLIGTVLITYYKQLSEGYEDRRKYQIMKNVGLPDRLIKKTAEKQIVWMFFIPLAVALIHSLVASKIVYQLLQMFGVNSYLYYARNIGIVIAVFSIVYLIIFKITSNVYYRIVK